MSCDISTVVEVLVNGVWVHSSKEIFKARSVFTTNTTDIFTDSPFDWRDYGMFSFLANVRNASNVKPLSEPRGVPNGCTVHNDQLEDLDLKSWTWFSLRELMGFDYSQSFVDQSSEAPTQEVTIREFLGPDYFEDLETLKTLGCPDQVRVVIYFSA